MKKRCRMLTLALGFLAAAAAFGADPPATGVVKGTITAGGKPQADAVVSVEGVARKNGAAPWGDTAPAVIDQRGLKFIPRVLAVMVHKTVDFPNNDTTFHNVFAKSEAKKFDLGLYPPGQSRNVNFDKPGVVRVLCNVHPAMEAFVVVKDHPYFSAADSRGNFTIRNVPPGKYRLEIWHPDFGQREMPFEIVRGGEVLTLDADLKK